MFINILTIAQKVTSTIILCKSRTNADVRMRTASGVIEVRNYSKTPQCECLLIRSGGLMEPLVIEIRQIRRAGWIFNLKKMYKIK